MNEYREWKDIFKSEDKNRITTVCFVGSTCYIAELRTIRTYDCISHTLDTFVEDVGDYITSMCCGHDPSELYVGTNIGFFVTVSTLTKKIVEWNVGKRTSLVQMSLGPAGVVFISAGDRTIRSYDIVSGECIKTHTLTSGGFNTIGWFLSMCYNRKHNKLFAVAQLQLSITSVDIQSDSVTYLDGHKAPIYSITLLSEDKLVSGAMDGSMRIWDTLTQVCIMNFAGDTQGVIMCAAPDNHHVISLSLGGDLKVWGDNRQVVQSSRVFRGRGKHLAISPDGRFVMVGCCAGVNIDINVFEVNPIFSYIVNTTRCKRANDEHRKLVALDEHGCLRLPSNAKSLWMLSPHDVIDRTRSRIYIALHACNPSMAIRGQHSVYIETDTEAGAVLFLEAIRAVQWQLSLAADNRCQGHQIVVCYRFNVLQQVNRMLGGKGLVSQMTVPVTVMRLIGWYTVTQ